MFKSLWVIGLLLAAISLGCSDTPEESKDVTITAAGVNAYGLDGVFFRVEQDPPVPIEFTMKRLADDDPGVVGAVYDLDQWVVFPVPVTVSLPYDAGAVEGAETELTVVTASTPAGPWKAHETTVYTDVQRVQAVISDAWLIAVARSAGNGGDTGTGQGAVDTDTAEASDTGEVVTLPPQTGM